MCALLEVSNNNEGCKEVFYESKLRNTGGTIMTTITMELPETVFSALQTDPQEFTRQMRIAAAIKWYELGRISQNKGAEIAGLSRAGFIDALSAAKVSPLQVTPEQLREELADAD